MSVAAPSVLIERHDSSKFQETIAEDPAISSQMEGGWTPTRPRFTRRPPNTYALSFTDISDADKQALQQLYTDTRGGSEIISGWTHPTSGAAINVRFKQGSVPAYAYKGYGGNHRWDVSGVILEEI